MTAAPFEPEEKRKNEAATAYTPATINTTTTTAPTPRLTRSSDDQSSVLTLSHYPSSTWMDTVVQVGSLPSIGLVALLAITHPLFFLAGAGVSMVGYGGGSYLFQCMGIPSQHQGDDDDHYDDHDDEGRNQQAEKNRGTDADEHGKEGAVPIKEVTVQQFPEATEPAPKSSSSSSAIPAIEQSPSTEHLIQDAYMIPLPLNDSIIEGKEFYALHARDFFKIFFSDEAPFSYQDFQKRRGDININYGKWGGSSERTIEFQTPSKNPLTSNNYAKATKTHQLLHHSKACVVMQSITNLKDIPFSNSFHVQERWVITSTTEKIITLRVSAQVNFVKPCPFEHQIRSKTVSTLKKTLENWCIVAQKAIRISQKRERQKEAAAMMAKQCHEDIEVEFSSRKNKGLVLGEEQDDDDEEEEDWEMEPVLAATSSSSDSSSGKRRLRSFSGIRRSITKTFSTKKKVVND